MNLSLYPLCKPTALCFNEYLPYNRARTARSAILICSLVLILVLRKHKLKTRQIYTAHRLILAVFTLNYITSFFQLCQQMLFRFLTSSLLVFNKLDFEKHNFTKPEPEFYQKHVLFECDRRIRLEQYIFSFGCILMYTIIWFYQKSVVKRNNEVMYFLFEKSRIYKIGNALILGVSLFLAMTWLHTIITTTSSYDTCMCQRDSDTEENYNETLEAICFLKKAFPTESKANLWIYMWVYSVF